MRKYHLRPGYGSENLLLEFLGDHFATQLLADLFASLAEINPQLASVENNGLADEIACTISSSQGDFNYSKDIWGFAFILAENNQAGLLSVAGLLAKSNLFEEIEVEFKNYK